MILQVSLLVITFAVKNGQWCGEREPNSQVCLQKPSKDNGFIVKKWCFVEIISMVLLLLSGPLLLLLVASFFAFRERNGPQVFNERKFLTFGCLNVSLLLIAVGIGYKFISSYHGFTLLCFGTQITGIIFLGCFIVPRIYVGVMRSRHGKDVFHLEEHGNEKLKKNGNRQSILHMSKTKQNKEYYENNAKDLQTTSLKESIEVTKETPEVKIKEFSVDLTNSNIYPKMHNDDKNDCNDSSEYSDVSISVSSIDISITSYDGGKINSLPNSSDDEENRYSLVYFGRKTIYDEKRTTYD